MILLSQGEEEGQESKIAVPSPYYDTSKEVVNVHTVQSKYMAKLAKKLGGSSIINLEKSYTDGQLFSKIKALNSSSNNNIFDPSTLSLVQTGMKNVLLHAFHRQGWRVN